MKVYNLSSCSSRLSRQIINPNYSAYIPNNFIRRYSNKEASGNGHEHREDHGRAPSTAETFERVAQEKEKLAQEKAQQEVTSQTIDKAEDSFEEATTENSSEFEKEQ